MMSMDTNILLAALDPQNLLHTAAKNFLRSAASQSIVVISEFVLVELYGLLRNPAVLSKPLSEPAAVDFCESFRQHPDWQVVGFPADSKAFHDRFWPRLAEKNFARRRAYDWRMALSLLEQGVTEFATVNLKDFRDFGFKKVWNPLQS